MDNSVDPFAENSGTARFVGEQAISESSPAHDFQTMKLATTTKSTTGRTEIPHNELVKMLYYLEGELQARDVVIAALRNERVKEAICHISQLRTKRIQASDPYAAIFRDKVALAGNLISRESSIQAAQAEMEVRQIIEQQMEQQYQMVSKQRATHLRMVNILTESLENNQRMLHELEEEKRKHEHDTAQGDDITYGLELERTKLRQELEEERAQVKKLEKDLKKLQETLDYERNRQKQIVLLLIAERKKILMKYIEEGKRSEDLAQILAEEKQRSDNIAEGLEEESKKSLRMEEELEKQAAAFEIEKKNLRTSLAKEETRVKELEHELTFLRNENETLKKQLSQNPTPAVPTTTGTIKARNFTEETCSPVVNIAKIVQPTATVSSVPVCGPTTGIARSIAPGQNIRNAGVLAAASPSSTVVASPSAPTIEHSVAVGSNVASIGEIASSIAQAQAQQPQSTSTLSSVVVATAPQPSPVKMQPTATIQRAPGGKFSALAAASHSLDQASMPPHPVPIAVPPVTVPPAGARGAPPPIPPNKPIVPPKREPSLSRIGWTTSAAAAAAPATANATSAAVATSANLKSN